MFNSLYAIWLDAHEKNALPPEWALFIVFRSWAIENGYKAEYGYEGEFAADNLIAALPGATTAEPEDGSENDTGQAGQTINSEDDAGVNGAAASTTTGSFITGHLDAEDLFKKLKLDELKKLAADMSIDIGDAETKRPIAELLAAAEVSIPVDDAGALNANELPEWLKENQALIGTSFHKTEG